MKWFRLYDEILDDPKMMELSAKEFQTWIMLLCLANRETTGKRGEIPRSFTVISRQIHCEIRVISRILKRFIDLGILIENGESIKIVNWDKRQFKSDDVLQRVKRYRNVTVTAPDTDTDTDTDKEKKNTQAKKVSFQLPDWFPEETWSVFLSHRKAVKAPLGEKSYPLFIEKFFKLKNKGWNPQQVIDIMVEKGWRWFKPEWVKKDKDDPMVRKFGEKGVRNIENLAKWMEDTKDEK